MSGRVSGRLASGSGRAVGARNGAYVTSAAVLPERATGVPRFSREDPSHGTE
jgi:hypothetical protein